MTEFKDLIRPLQENLTSTHPQDIAKLNWLIGGTIAIVIILAINLIVDYWKHREKKHGKERYSLKGMKQNAIKRQLEETLETQAEAKKKYEKTKIMTQAGLKMTYGELQIISILSSALCSIFVLLFMKNPILGLMMVPLGYMIPLQIVNFIRNRRLAVLERELESFMELFVERYKTVKSASRSFEDCLTDFEPGQPIYYEIQETLFKIGSGTPSVDAIKDMALRTGNTFFIRMTNYLEIAETIGTDDVRDRLMSKALLQARKYKTRKNVLKQKIQSPKNQCMVLLFAVPGVLVYQTFTTEGYIDFMINDMMGKIGSAVIAAIFIGALWFINKKIGSPIE